MITEQYITAEGLPMQFTNKAISAFIMKITIDAAARGITVTITDSKNVYAGDGTQVCCGIFIPPLHGRGRRGKGQIRVAAGGQSLAEAVLSLAHEYIHMRQYFNKEKIYYTHDYLKLETNTEKRALTFMKRNSLPTRLMNQAIKSSSVYLNDLKFGTI